MTERTALITAGEPAPDIALPAADGERYVLSEALRHGPVLLAFFLLDCRACDVAYMPWDRAYETYAGDDFQLWSVCLDPAEDAAAFWEKSGVSFPVLFDDGRSAEAYGLISTPTHVLVGTDGRVVVASDAWDRAAWNATIAEAARLLGRPAIEVIAAEAPDFRPGCTIHT